MASLDPSGSRPPSTSSIFCLVLILWRVGLKGDLLLEFKKRTDNSSCCERVDCLLAYKKSKATLVKLRPLIKKISPGNI